MLGDSADQCPVCGKSMVQLGFSIRQSLAAHVGHCKVPVQILTCPDGSGVFQMGHPVVASADSARSDVESVGRSSASNVSQDSLAGFAYALDDWSDGNSDCVQEVTSGMGEETHHVRALTPALPVGAAGYTAWEATESIQALISEHSRKQFSGTPLVELVFEHIICAYALSGRCRTALKNWFLLSQPHVRDRIPGRSGFLNGRVLQNIGPMTTPVHTKRLVVKCVGKHLRVDLRYRDPMVLIGRELALVLHRYGERAFEVGCTRNERGETILTHAQDAAHMRRIRDAVPLDIMLVPVMLCIDGAQMRANGIHSLTPISLYLVHRFMHDGPLEPRVIAYAPKTPDDGKASEDTPCVMHAVLQFLLDPFAIMSEPAALERHSLVVRHDGSMIKWLPVLYRFACDMPMVATVSVTLNSRMTQERPCQVCLVTGSDAYNAQAKFEYREEEPMFALSEQSGGSAARQRAAYNIRHIPGVKLRYLNRWDERGLFALVGVDWMHGFKLGILRQLANISLYIVDRYAHEKRVRDSDALAELDASGIVHDIESDLGELGSSDTNESDGGESTRRKKRRKVSGGRRTADNITRIRKSALGKYLVAISNVQDQERLTRSTGAYIPIRRTPNPFDQLSKMVENKYSPGLLVQVIVAVACDGYYRAMGRAWNAVYLSTCCQALSVYAKLSLARPTDAHVGEANNLVKSLMDMIGQLRQLTGITWDAPKIHALLHLCKDLEEFGRKRLHDTCTSESLMRVCKRVHRKVAGVNLAAPHKYMLEQHERFDIADISNLLLDPTEHSMSNSYDSRTGDPTHPLAFRAAPVPERVVCTGTWPEAPVYSWSCARTRSTGEWSFRVMDMPSFPANVHTSSTSGGFTSTTKETVALWDTLTSHIQKSHRTWMPNEVENSHEQVYNVSFTPRIAVRQKHATTQGERFIAFWNYYGKERYDFVQYWDDVRQRLRYARLLMIGTIAIDVHPGRSNDELSPGTELVAPCVQAIVVVRHLKVERVPPINSGSTVCAHVRSIFDHVREEAGVKIVMASQLRCKVTSFLDTYNSGTALDSGAASSSSSQYATRCGIVRESENGQVPARWWFILRPDVFDGIELWS
ncbi:hypothetical protein FVE85_7762 [Porphyridium purpureum]|uniref:Uncharacterized protein n=1 Tax=Porphyridium purpureum TaxID=35688 RepID=A0A5J4YIR4_PORPP|nr:hypothetical protein FVE85_7762 [Porphyridium purpureum]|eukprot:POR1148..scf210_14